VKQELEILRRGKIKHENVLLPRTSYHPVPIEWEEPCPESFDVSLFGVSTFYNTYGAEEVQKGKTEQTSNGNINRC
jgi:hypothetical protein